MKSLFLFLLVLIFVSFPRANADQYDDYVKAYQEQAQEMIKSGDTEQAILVLQKLKTIQDKHTQSVATTGPQKADGKHPTDQKATPASGKIFGDFFQNLNNHDLTLKRTSSTSGTADPATFSFLQDLQDHTKSGFTAAFDLEYTPLLTPDATDTIVYNHTSAEGLVSSVPKTQNTKWDFEQGIDLYTQGNSRNSVATYTTLAFKDESDQDFTLNRLSGDIVMTPTSFTPSYGYIGTPFPSASSPIYLVWRPYFGANAGGLITSAKVPTVDQNAPVRLSERTYARLVVPPLSQILNLTDFYLFADDTIYYIPTSDNARNYLTSGAVFSFTKNISLNFTYDLGQNAPVFKSAQTIQASLGIQF